MDFPGKILLFGEYGILLSPMALSLPFYRYSGRLKFAGANGNHLSKIENGSMDELKNLYGYLKSRAEIFYYLDLNRFGEDLNNTIYFDSSIPQGSGIGSSGALTAAIYARYLTGMQPQFPAGTRQHLSSIETHFHGNSSGIDPITSYLGRPVLLEDTSLTCKTPDLSGFFDAYTLFLVNTRYRAKTSELVGEFMADYQNPGYRKAIDNQYIPLISATIGAAISGDFQLFELLMKSYSLFQLTHFGKMIPAALKSHFEHGIDGEDFCLKLCGSGGGGYMLAITRNRRVTESYFKLNQLEYSVVEKDEILYQHAESFYKHLNI